MNDSSYKTVTRIRSGMIFETVKIPDNCVICPECEGQGMKRWRYSEPSFTNNPAVTDYMPCIYCDGQGYLEKELNERMQKLYHSSETTVKKEDKGCA